MDCVHPSPMDRRECTSSSPLRHLARGHSSASGHSTILSGVLHSQGQMYPWFNIPARLIRVSREEELLLKAAGVPYVISRFTEIAHSGLFIRLRTARTRRFIMCA